MSARTQYFEYSAYGAAFGGVITAPDPRTIPSTAMACLSPSGGYGTSSAENSGIRDVLYVRSATTTVQGDTRRTEVTVTLEDGEFMDRLQFDRIVLQMTATPLPGGGESWITPAGSLIEGLRVDGKAVPLVNKTDVFDKYPRYSELEKAYAAGELKDLILRPDVLSTQSCEAANMVGCTSRVGDIKATLFPLAGYTGWLPVENGGLRIKDFGTLYLGEYRITRYARTLTMLRVELGCEREGSGSFGSGGVNGHEEPPS